MYECFLFIEKQCTPNLVHRFLAEWLATGGSVMTTTTTDSLSDAQLVALGERVVVPLIWRHDDGATLAFACIVSLWSAHDTLWSIDLHPADAATWAWLDRYREESFANP